ncbi:hypothetical protein ElyMa_002445400 [Elysia marginata]|uniref:Uncharacterized protein n=1 Tax=Elysia marginata TaxID=1093978 RepID=A0AAV4GKM2_9GAST|nr:hypothetical protein ElyMa_002445400 [Elysia marginata]
MDWSKCIVCQAEIGKKNKLSCPAKSTQKDTGVEYETFIKNIRLFEGAGCEDLPEWIKSEVKDAETLAIIIIIIIIIINALHLWQGSMPFTFGRV